jgi:hypothetical protein
VANAPTPDGEPSPALRRLIDDGLVRIVDGGAPRTTARFQAAMARAAFRLFRAEGPGGDDFDLRVPLASALLEIYGATASDEEISTFLAALLPIEAAELDPRAHLSHLSR